MSNITSKPAPEKPEAPAAEEADDDDDDEKPKVKKEDDDGVDPMMKYLSTISADHEDEAARKHVIEVFKKLADDQDHGMDMLSQSKAQLAYEQVFEDWKVDLTSEQEQRFERDHFIPAFREFAGTNDFSTLSVANAVPFMRQLMSLSIEERAKIQMFQRDHVNKPKPDNKQQNMA